MQPDSTGGRPGDDYISNTTWPEILEPCGWKKGYESGGVTHWQRPGKDVGTSATTNYAESGLLFVFSSNAPHFEPGHSYNKFAAFAHLNFRGDYRAAARDLAGRGFGKALGEDKEALPQFEAEPGPEGSTREAGSYIEFAPVFLAVEDPPVEYLINELIPRSAVLLLHGDPRTRTSAWLTGQSASADDSRILALQGKTVACLHEHPTGASSNVIVKLCPARREDVLAALNRLHESAEVDCCGGGSRGKTRTWFLSTVVPLTSPDKPELVARSARPRLHCKRRPHAERREGLCCHA